MADIVPFPGARPEPRRVVIALEDELFAFLPTTRLRNDEHVIEYVAASSLRDPEAEADLWLGRYVASAEDRKFFFQTLSGALYEFDADRHVWRNEKLVCDGELVDFGVPASNERGILRTAHVAALLFMTPAQDGWHLRMRLTTPVLLVGRLPVIPKRRSPSAQWLSLARPGRHGNGVG